MPQAVPHAHFHEAVVVGSLILVVVVVGLLIVLPALAD